MDMKVIVEILRACAPYVTVDAGKVLEAFMQGDVGRLEAVRDEALSAELKVLAVVVADVMGDVEDEKDAGKSRLAPTETPEASQGVMDEIVSIQRTTAKGGQPMWRCWTRGERFVTVIDHADVTINTFVKFRDAGYDGFMRDLPDGKRVDVKPIRAELREDGKWWRVAWVDVLQVGDEAGVIEHDEPAEKRTLKALVDVIGGRDWVVFDVETTGFDSVDDIVQIAIIDSRGEVLVNTLVRPREPERLTVRGKNGKSSADVHGITPEKVRGAPKWADIYKQVFEALDDKVWLAYNADFDVRMLGQSLRGQGLAIPEARDVVCVMKAYAEHAGEWDAKKGDYRWHKLEEAVKGVGSVASFAHTALGDAKMARDVALGIVDDGVPF